MKTHIIIYILLALAVALPIQAQRIESGYIAPSNLKNNHGSKPCKGAVQYISGNYSMPLAIERVQQIKNTYNSTTTPSGQVIIQEKSDTVTTARMWQVTLTGKYAAFDYEGTALQYLPDNIINAGAMITHVCPSRHHTKRHSIIYTPAKPRHYSGHYIPIHRKQEFHRRHRRSGNNCIRPTGVDTCTNNKLETCRPLQHRAQHTRQTTTYHSHTDKQKNTPHTHTVRQRTLLGCYKHQWR